MQVSPALAQLLADRRKALNGKVAAARSRDPGLDTAALSTFLIDPLDPLLGSVLTARPDGGMAFLDAGFDMALALVGHGWAGDGTRGDFVRHVWRELAPQLAHLIAGNPRETLGALTNAAIKLAGIPGVRLADWFSSMRALAGEVKSAADLRGLVILAGWRTGAAQLRAAALAVELDPAIACRAVGAASDADWEQLKQAFQAQRWWTPDRSTPPQGHRLGRFTGFGGNFSEPPQLAVLQDSFILASSGRHFVLEADAYGATIRRTSAEHFAQASPAQPCALAPGNQLRADDRLVPCAWPQDGLKIAMTADSMAVVSPYSHAVQVLPKVLP